MSLFPVAIKGVFHNNMLLSPDRYLYVPERLNFLCHFLCFPWFERGRFVTLFSWNLLGLVDLFIYLFKHHSI